MSFEKYILPENGGPKLPVHAFAGIMSEYLLGNRTLLEAQTAIEGVLGVTLSANDLTDVFKITGVIDAKPGSLEKREAMDEVYRVLILAEHGVWYGDRESLRVKMGWTK